MTVIITRWIVDTVESAIIFVSCFDVVVVVVDER